MNREDVKLELRKSLPSIRLLHVVSNLVIEHPETKELIFLKQRPGFENVSISDYINYSERHDLLHFYGELIGKSVILDISLLGDRGRKALNDWVLVGK